VLSYALSSSCEYNLTSLFLNSDTSLRLCFGRFRVFRVNAKKSGLTVGFYPLQLFLQRCVASDQTMALLVSPRAAHQWCGSNCVGSTHCRWDIVQPVMGCIIAIKIVSIWGDTACSSGVETIRLWGSVCPGNV
jgi:hypothetical protein